MEFRIEIKLEEEEMGGPQGWVIHHIAQQNSYSYIVSRQLEEVRDSYNDLLA